MVGATHWILTQRYAYFSSTPVAPLCVLMFWARAVLLAEPLSRCPDVRGYERERESSAALLGRSEKQQQRLKDDSRSRPFNKGVESRKVRGLKNVLFGFHVSVLQSGK